MRPRQPWYRAAKDAWYVMIDGKQKLLSLRPHELRTSITNIKAYSELLADEPGLNLERQKEFCNIIGSRCPS